MIWFGTIQACSSCSEGGCSWGRSVVIVDRKRINDSRFRRSTFSVVELAKASAVMVFSIAATACVVSSPMLMSGASPMLLSSLLWSLSLELPLPQASISRHGHAPYPLQCLHRTMKPRSPHGTFNQILAAHRSSVLSDRYVSRMVALMHKRLE